MKRVLAALVCLSQLSGISAFAAEKKEPVLPPLSLEDAFFGPGANPPLTAQEVAVRQYHHAEARSGAGRLRAFSVRRAAAFHRLRRVSGDGCGA